MADRSFLDWPFFEPRHRRLAEDLDAWAILSAQAKADVADHDTYHAALKAADFPSVRGSFEFGNNQHPIQTFYAREVIKRDDGVITNKVVGTAFENHVDAFAAECPMP